MMIRTLYSNNVFDYVLVSLILLLIFSNGGRFEERKQKQHTVSIALPDAYEDAFGRSTDNMVLVVVSEQTTLPFPIEHFQTGDIRIVFANQSLKQLRPPAWGAVPDWRRWKVPAHDENVHASLGAPFVPSPSICITLRRLLI